MSHTGPRHLLLRIRWITLRVYEFGRDPVECPGYQCCTVSSPDRSATLPDPQMSYSEQKRYAEKIKPIRKIGHLLVTLLLSNMIVNETLPVVADPVLGRYSGVVVGTVLIVL